MRLVTYEVASPTGGLRRTGALATDDAVVDLASAREALHVARGRASARRVAEAEVPTDMLALLALGEPGLDAAREALAFALDDGVEEHAGATVRHPAGAVRLLAPLPRPNSLRDFMVVEEHVRRSLGDRIAPEWWNIPVYYKGNCDEVYGPEDVVPWPAYTEKLDYELEICAVVGRAGRDVAVEEAEALIVGYTLYNDWSARDIQMREMSVGLGPGYGKDFASSFGPAIVTTDEFDRDTARMEARVDGEVWSSGTLGTMRFSFAEIAAWASQSQTLHPGDLLGSGTVGGGCGLELDRWITEGATVELEAEGIGVLRNVVGQRSASPPGPASVLSAEGSVR